MSTTENMATSTTIDVDNFDDIDTQDGGMDTLDFQNIPHESPAKGKGQTHEFTNFPHSAADSDDDEDDKAKLLEEKKRTSSFWTFAYYQQFFDVETKQVGQRILGSMLPRPGANYLMKQIRPNPDLYGPFWICTTLVFTTAIAGNLANYFTAAGKEYHWQYDFHKVTFAATAIFSYWWLIPLLLFGILWWRGSQAKFTFLEMICVYGYSLAIYIPISILWAIQISWLQWTLVLLGAALSGSVLLFTFWPAVSEGNKKIAIGLMVFIFIMHAALAAGFVLYFFHVPSASTTPAVPVTNTTTVAPPHKPLSQLQQNAALPDNTDIHNLESADVSKVDNKGAQGATIRPPQMSDNAANKKLPSGEIPLSQETKQNPPISENDRAEETGSVAGSKKLLRESQVISKPKDAAAELNDQLSDGGAKKKLSELNWNPTKRDKSSRMIEQKAEKER